MVVSDHTEQAPNQSSQRTPIDDQPINRTTSSHEIDALRFPGMTDSKPVNNVLTDYRRRYTLDAMMRTGRLRPEIKRCRRGARGSFKSLLTSTAIESATL